MHSQTWVFVVWLVGVVSADFDPAKYSFCLADRGYVVEDGNIAGAALYNELTPQTGLVMEPNYCIYRHVNSTIVSLCNGSARNRTVTRDEVRRGVQQLQKDCGADGSFSGYHIVNNLTFANYGTTGIPKASAPGNPPDTPGRRRSFYSAKFPQTKFRRDGCTPGDCSSVGFNGTAHFCCPEPEGHNLQADGSCPVPGPEKGCQAYCEVKRTGLLGVEVELDGIIYNQPTDLSEGTDISVETGFDLGIGGGIYKEIFDGAVGYTWTKGITKTKSITKKATVTELAPGNRIKWVYFPNLIETCGSVSSRKYTPGQSCSNGQPSCGTGTGAGFCSGDIVTVGNICSLSPALDKNGAAIVSFAERIEDASGTPLKIDQQSTSYKGVCALNGANPDPDGDGESECKAEV